MTSAVCRAWLRYYLAQMQRPFLLLADISLGVIEQTALSVLQELLSAWRRVHRVKACHRLLLGSADLGASALAAGQLSENPMKISENRGLLMHAQLLAFFINMFHLCEVAA